MSKNARIHEVAKAIGTSAKLLMAELKSIGHEFKTHMAVLEGDAWSYIEKKHPDILAKIEEVKKAAPKKKASPRKKKVKSRVVTTRTKDAKKEEAKSVPEGPAKTTVVERDQGLVGTVTMEQKVIRGGIIRRRRVEEPPVEEAPKPVETPVEKAPVEIVPPVVQKEEKPEPKIEAKVVEKEAPQTVEVKAPSRSSGRPAPPSTPRRNLSSSPTLKVVGQGKTPDQIEKEREVRKVAIERVKAQTQADRKPKKTTPLTEREKTEAEKKLKAAGLEDKNLNKRQLINMTEEVEIQRPYARRKQKQGRGGPKEVRQTQKTVPSAQKRKIRIEDEIVASDLAGRMGVKAADVVRKLLEMGQMVTVHQTLDFETASIIASEWNYEVENVAKTVESFLNVSQEEEKAENLVSRPPVVTVMGHVDHGKTSLLDHIRKTRVASGESGGITQHIGAYQVEHQKQKITFIDTPGHAAFSKMRARGAEITDIVILVVAADEGVKPQTIEAIAHAKSAGVPIIVAINKMDKPDVNPEKVTQELSGHEVVHEDWGGDVMFAKVSAETGQGIDELLEKVLLQAEVVDAKANPNRSAQASIIEARLDKGRGPVATVIIQKGTLRQGDNIVSGLTFGKVRAMMNEAGKQLKEAGPSTPVEILGLDTVPEVGDELTAVDAGAIAKKAQSMALDKKRRQEALKTSKLTLEDMMKQIEAGEMAELRVVLKGDAHGSLEAIADSLEKIEHEQVRVKVIYKAVGGISETDISLAAASGALILGFHVRPSSQAKSASGDEGVTIETFDIIYELIDHVKNAMSGLLSPIVSEKVVGTAQVRETYSISRLGTIAGCLVKEGRITRNGQARLIRDGVVVYTAKISSLKRFKDDAREVKEGLECGIMIENYNDIKVGDEIECFEEVQKAQMVG